MKSIDLEFTCTRCRKPFIPTGTAIRQGEWRVCAQCRDGPDATGTPESCDSDPTP